MTRGRKPTTAAPAVLDGETLAHAEPLVRADLDATDAMTTATRMVVGYEETFRQIGQIEAFEFQKRISDVAMAQIFENLKESKSYVGLPYKDRDGNWKRVSTLDELCEVKFGKTGRRMRDLSQNLRLLGPELYEQSEKLGLRNIDYKALRALPADDQEAVKAALEEGKSRDDLIDLLQEMAVRHHQTTTALSGEVAELQANAEAQAKVMADKTATADRLALELEKSRRRYETLPRDEAAEALRLEVSGRAIAVEGALTREIGPGIAALLAADPSQRAHCDAMLTTLEALIAELRRAHGLNDAELAAWTDGLAADLAQTRAAAN